LVGFTRDGAIESYIAFSYGRRLLRFGRKLSYCQLLRKSLQDIGTVSAEEEWAREVTALSNGGCCSSPVAGTWRLRFARCLANHGRRCNVSSKLAGKIILAFTAS